MKNKFVYDVYFVIYAFYLLTSMQNELNVCKMHISKFRKCVEKIPRINPKFDNWILRANLIGLYWTLCVRLCGCEFTCCLRDRWQYFRNSIIDFSWAFSLLLWHFHRLLLWCIFSFFRSFFSFVILLPTQIIINKNMIKKKHFDSML